MASKYSISTDGENFNGKYDTEEEAVSDGVSHGYTSFHVGALRPPTQPEYFWNACDWLEMVSCQDDYGGEWAEDWDNSTKQEREELEKEVRDVLRRWLDKYSNRPTHFCVDNSVEYVVENGVARKK